MLYREYLLLKVLTESNSLINVDQIVAELHITKRTAYISINGINEWLVEHNLNKLMSVRAHGYYIQPNEISLVKKNLNFEINQGKVEFPQNIRIITIEFALLCKSRPVSIKYLNSLNGVSQRTTQKDLARLKKELRLRNLQLFSSNQSYSILGKEEDIRKFGLQKLTNIQGTAIYDKISNFINLSESEKAKIEHTLLVIEQNTECYLTDESIFQVKEFIGFSLIRYRNKHYLAETEINTNYQSTSQALINKLLNELGILKVDIIHESDFLLKIINSRQISKITKANTSNELYAITGEIIKKFSVISGIDMGKNSNLQQSLFVHLIATQRRVHYKMQFFNSNAVNIKNKYPELYLLTKQAVRPFEKYLNQELTVDEIELIAIYFGGELEQINGAREEIDSKKILLVCGNGIGTSRLLKIRLERVLPSSFQIQVITKQRYEKLPAVKAELVIATLPVSSKGPPIVNIDNSLSNYNLESIKNYLTLNTTNTPIVKTTQILDIVSEYAQVKDFSGLTEALQSYFSEKNNLIKKKQTKLPSLSELLPLKRIVFKSKKSTWQEAVKVGGALLERDGISNSEYTNMMGLQIKKYGPYMKISEGIMLLHAKPIDSNKFPNAGMSLLHFDQPVKFNDKVKANYIFSLYAPICNLHLRALTQLTEILSDKKLFLIFERAKTAEEITKLFTFINKRGEGEEDGIDTNTLSSIKN